MSARLNNAMSSAQHVDLVPYGTPIGAVPPSVSAAMESGGVPWARYIDALRRHALLMAVIVMAGGALGLVAARRVQPVYDVQSTVWIEAGPPAQSGPIRPQQLLTPTSWIELFRSYSIVDPIVRKLKLNVHYAQPADSVFFEGFESLPSLRPGAYELKAEKGDSYLLSSAKGALIERGVLGDSVGRKVGFGWAPDARLFTPERVLTFWISSPRSTSIGLLSNLRSSLPDDGQFLKIMLSGSDPNSTATTLNAWVEQFVTTAGDLKKRHLIEFKKILGDELAVAETQLRSAEGQLQHFRIATITLPSGGAADGLAAETGGDQSVGGYFQQKGTLSEVHAERTALEQMVVEAKGGPLNPQAFLMLPTILNNAPQLRAAIEELSLRQAALRTERQFLTDANPRIKQLSETVRLLQYETIPQIVQSVLQTLRRREQAMSARLENQSLELRAIPARAVEQARLMRQVAATENLYNMLKTRYEDVSLAEAQGPDLSVLDYAVPPTHPNSNDAPRLLLLAILASLGLAAAVSLFHDRIDRRFRYPDQATNDLGLTIAGTVPKLRSSRSGEFQVELMSQVVESFRTLRLAVRYEFPADGPVVLAVSSPSSNDGKSLVSSNLALAFASAGHQTLLIDGDVRRGTLHSTFDIQVTPGLVEYLSNGMGVDVVLKPTRFENLFLLPRGARANRAPELLISDRMNALIQAARQKFDVVIIDSPPFVAGVDAYALAAAAGNILVVLRQGMSDRKLAAAKLAIVDRLPVRFVGAVINAVPNGGMYRYYGTDYSQGGMHTKPVGSLATPRGLVVGP